MGFCKPNYYWRGLLCKNGVNNPWMFHGRSMIDIFMMIYTCTVYLEIASNNMRGEIYVCFLNKFELSKKTSSIGSSQVEWDMNHDVFFSTGNAVLYSSRKSQIKPL